MMLQPSHARRVRRLVNRLALAAEAGLPLGTVEPSQVPFVDLLQARSEPLSGPVLAAVLAPVEPLPVESPPVDVEAYASAFFGRLPWSGAAKKVLTLPNLAPAPARRGNVEQAGSWFAALPWGNAPQPETQELRRPPVAPNHDAGAWFAGLPWQGVAG